MVTCTALMQVVSPPHQSTLPEVDVTTDIGPIVEKAY
jgi:hypothetical protein